MCGKKGDNVISFNVWKTGSMQKQNGAFWKDKNHTILY